MIMTAVYSSGIPMERIDVFSYCKERKVDEDTLMADFGRKKVDPNYQQHLGYGYYEVQPNKSTCIKRYKKVVLKNKVFL